MTNDLLQWGAVAMMIIIAGVWAIRRWKKKPEDKCDDGCGDCPLVNTCNNTKQKKR